MIEHHYWKGYRQACALRGVDPYELRKQAAYGDLSTSEILGQGLKYGIGGPLNVLTAPFSIPLAMLQSGGAAVGADLARTELGERGPKLIGGQGLAQLAHPSSGSLLRRINELQAADPAVAQQFQEYLSGIQDDDRYTGTSEAAAYIPGVLNAATLGNMGANVLGSAISGAGGQARFAEGLGGDRAGFMRRWFDPTGYSTKNIAYELQQTNPELAAKMLTALQSSSK